MKKGRISKQEEQYIQDNLSLMSHVDIAEKLDSDPEEWCGNSEGMGALQVVVARVQYPL